MVAMHAEGERHCSASDIYCELQSKLLCVLQRRKTEMEDVFMAAIPPQQRGGSRFVFRQGNPLTADDLKRVAAGELCGAGRQSSDRLDTTAEGFNNCLLVCSLHVGFKIITSCGPAVFLSADEASAILVLADSAACPDASDSQVRPRRSAAMQHSCSSEACNKLCLHMSDANLQLDMF